MKIWVDGQALQTESRYRGIGRYVLQLLTALSESDGAVEFDISFNLAINPDTFEDAIRLVRTALPKCRVHTWHGLARRGEAQEGHTEERRASEAILAYHVAEIGPDVALSCSPFEGEYDPAVPLLSRHGQSFPMVAIFYDAIPVRFPDAYFRTPSSLHYYLRRLKMYEAVDHVLTISDFADRELREFAPNVRSRPIYAGLSSEFMSLLEGRERDIRQSTALHDMGRYVLFVGGFDWRKNLDLLAASFPGLPEDVRLVVVGSHDTVERDILLERWAELELASDRLVLFGQASDAELIELYQNTDCYVQPSLMEGFGLTVLEAVAAGAPLLSSGTGALGEIVGNPVNTISPLTADVLREKLEDCLSRPEAYRIDPDTVRSFTWENAAKLALESLEQVMAEAGGAAASPASSAVKALEAVDADPEQLAEGLALAAARRRDASSRTLWDVSATILAEHVTGIQRVVLRTVEELSRDPRNVFIMSRDEDPFHECKFANGRLVRTAKPVELTCDDTIVMLDSSWGVNHLHRPDLINARRLGARIATVVYDLVPIRTPGFCHSGLPPIFVDWFASMLSYSDSLICISRAVADEVGELLAGMNFNKVVDIHYWHLGSDFATLPKRRVARRKIAKSANVSDQEATRLNFLMVGTLEPRKGHRIAVEGFRRARRKGLDATLTIVGRPGWNTQSLQKELLIEKTLRGDIVWHDNASDDELQAAYRNADAIICSSHAEGFGLPIVEADAHGCDVIAADIPVFREVGSMAITRFFQAGNPQSLSEALLDYRRSEGGTSDAKALSWRESADALSATALDDSIPYIRYVPAVDRPMRSSTSIEMAGLLGPQQTRHSLELVQAPDVSDAGHHSIPVRLRPGPECFWSSRGAGGGVEGGIRLAARRVTPAGLQECDPPARSIIPYVVVSGLEYIFSIEVPKIGRATSDVVRIQFEQTAMQWLPEFIDVDLNRGIEVAEAANVGAERPSGIAAE